MFGKLIIEFVRGWASELESNENSGKLLVLQIIPFFSLYPATSSISLQESEQKEKIKERKK